MIVTTCNNICIRYVIRYLYGTMHGFVEIKCACTGSNTAVTHDFIFPHILHFNIHSIAHKNPEGCLIRL